MGCYQVAEALLHHNEFRIFRTRPLADSDLLKCSKKRTEYCDASCIQMILGLYVRTRSDWQGIYMLQRCITSCRRAARNRAILQTVPPRHFEGSVASAAGPTLAQYLHTILPVEPSSTAWPDFASRFAPAERLYRETASYILRCLSRCEFQNITSSAQ